MIIAPAMVSPTTRVTVRVNVTYILYIFFFFFFFFFFGGGGGCCSGNKVRINKIGSGIRVKHLTLASIAGAILVAGANAVHPSINFPMN